jgi:multidrug efflux system membrane fusion protein
MAITEHSERPNGEQLVQGPPSPRTREAPSVTPRAEWSARDPQHPHRRSFAWLWVSLLLIAVGVGGYFVYKRIHEAPAAGGPGGRPGGRGAMAPVVVATARKGDMNIYLDGLGSVIPLNTVTVRSRVDGQLMKVHFVEGQAVHEGDLLFEIDPRPFQVQLTQAEGQMAKDQALLKNAKADLERYQSAREAVSQQQLDTAAANVSNYEGATKIDQGQIDSAKLQLTYCHITAPLTGRIGLKMVDQGNMVHANDQNGLAVITQLQPIAVVFSLAEEDVPRVMRELNAGKKLPIDAYDRDFKNKLATGSLLAIDSQIDPTSATVRLKGVFPNENGALFPSQFVNARLLIDTIHDAVLVPSAAVQQSPTSQFVYVVKPDSTVDMRDVETGPSDGDNTVITRGLAVGETVVTEGVDKLQQGAKVNVGGRGGATRPTGGGNGTSRPSAEIGGGTTHAPGIPGGGGGNRGAGGNGGNRQGRPGGNGGPRGPQ